MTKYIFVTGGVVSSLGKGITADFFRPFIKKPWVERNDSKV